MRGTDPDLDLMAVGRTIVFAGMPLEPGGVLVGAVTVSSGSAQEDRRSVEAVVAAFGRGLSWPDAPGAWR